AHGHHSFSLQLVVSRSGISGTLLAPVESERRRELGTTVETWVARTQRALEGTAACGCRSAECSCADCWSTGAFLQRLPRAQQSLEHAKGSPQEDLFRCPNGGDPPRCEIRERYGCRRRSTQTWAALALPRPPRATSRPVRGFALSHLGQRYPEIAPVAVRTHPAPRALDGLDLRSGEHQELVCVAARPADAHAPLRSRRFPDATDPPVRDAHAVAQPHQPPDDFASSAASRFFSARSSSQRAVTSRMIAVIPTSAPDASCSRATVNSTEMDVPSFRIAG